MIVVLSVFVLLLLKYLIFILGFIFKKDIWWKKKLYFLCNILLFNFWLELKFLNKLFNLIEKDFLIKFLEWMVIWLYVINI